MLIVIACGHNYSDIINIIMALLSHSRTLCILLFPLQALLLSACMIARHPTDLSDEMVTQIDIPERFEFKEEFQYTVGLAGIDMSMPAGVYVPIMYDDKGVYYALEHSFQDAGFLVDFKHRKAWVWLLDEVRQESPMESYKNGSTSMGPGTVLIGEGIFRIVEKIEGYGVRVQKDVSKAFFESAVWENEKTDIAK